MEKVKRNIYLKIIMLEAFVAIAMRFLVPVLSNYPPLSEISDFQIKIEPLTHTQQYIMLGLLAIIAHIIFINFTFKDIFKYIKKDKTQVTNEEICKIRNQCFRMPYKISIIQAVLLIIVLGILFMSVEISVTLCIKFLLIYFSFFMSSIMISIILIQDDVNKIISSTYEINSNYIQQVRKTKFYNNLIFNLIPFFIVIIITLSLIGYSQVCRQIGESGYYFYKTHIDEIDDKNIDLTNLKAKLDKVPLKEKKDYFFVLYDDKEYFSSDSGHVTNFFKQYIDSYIDAMGGKIYEYYGVEEQAYVRKVNLDGYNEVYVGIKYSTTNISVIIFFASTSLIAILIYIIIMQIWSKNVSKNIIKVSESLDTISKQTEITKNNILPIMSNDEIGDLSYSYNKIQEKLLSQQEIIEKQAQFATLGEVAGGIAHDLNSPLLSIKADIHNMKKYVQSEKIQADEEVKNRLLSIVTNTEKNLENMSKTINSMRDQIRSTGDKDNQVFSVNKLVEGIKILMGTYLRNSNCTLNIISEENVEICGQDNKLDRVITNMVKNSIDAYKQNNLRGTIDITIKKEDNNCMIYVKDQAGGVSKEIKETLFKEMKTSKEKEGTGFGLYYAYRIIGGDFKGDITFETEEGKGTTFIIKIPLEGGI